MVILFWLGEISLPKDVMCVCGTIIIIKCVCVWVAIVIHMLLLLCFINIEICIKHANGLDLERAACVFILWMRWSHNIHIINLATIFNVFGNICIMADDYKENEEKEEEENNCERDREIYDWIVLPMLMK